MFDYKSFISWLLDETPLIPEYENDLLMQAQGATCTTGYVTVHENAVVGKYFTDGAIKRIIKYGAGNKERMYQVASEAMNRYTKKMNTLWNEGIGFPASLITV